MDYPRWPVTRRAFLGSGGTPELYFTDPDGILIQLQDVSYWGGSGYLGEVCGDR